MSQCFLSLLLLSRLFQVCVLSVTKDQITTETAYGLILQLLLPNTFMEQKRPLNQTYCVPLMGFLQMSYFKFLDFLFSSVCFQCSSNQLLTKIIKVCVSKLNRFPTYCLAKADSSNYRNSEGEKNGRSLKATLANCVTDNFF